MRFGPLTEMTRKSWQVQTLGVRGEAYLRIDHGRTCAYDSERTKSFASWNFGTHIFDVSGTLGT